LRMAHTLALEEARQILRVAVVHDQPTVPAIARGVQAAAPARGPARWPPAVTRARLARPRHPGRHALFQQGARDRVEEAGRGAREHLGAAPPDAGVRQVQLLLRAGDAHVEQPALLFELVRLVI